MTSKYEMPKLVFFERKPLGFYKCSQEGDMTDGYCQADAVCKLVNEMADEIEELRQTLREISEP